jgi:hypothetical protein
MCVHRSFWGRLALFGVFGAAFLACSIASRAAAADDVFYNVRVTELKFSNGSLPKPPTLNDRWKYLRGQNQEAYRVDVVADEGTEAYLYWKDDNDYLKQTDQPTGHLYTLAARARRGRDAAGWLLFPNADFTGMAKLRFTFPASVEGRDQAALRSEFYKAKEKSYAYYVREGVPGAAWFRWQMNEARAARGDEPEKRAPAVDRRRELPNEEFDLFTGGRAISENLALDRPLLLDAEGANAVVPVESLQGITIREMDWATLTKDVDPKLDPLAKRIPADQHALFFPTFEAMLTLLDEADAYGTPILQVMETRNEDAATSRRYQRQLCLDSSGLSRVFGPQAIASVALTGSDPYLRTGSDVALLFEAKNVRLLQTYLLTKHATAAAENSGVKAQTGKVDEVAYSGVRCPDRRICSYFAILDNVVIVTNSLYQLGRLVAVSKGHTSALSSLPEYKFFRHRYKLGEENETAFLMLSDATIRRWCGPRWRIGNSRRTRAGAVLADWQARLQDELLRDKLKSGEFKPPNAVGGFGELRLTSSGVVSSVHGALDFQTPIAEMTLDKVTTDEAAAYDRWRQGYERQWRQFFDPIAIRVSLEKDRLAADVTVMPLSAGTEYAWLRELTRKGKLTPEAGDRHAEALLHFAVGLQSAEPEFWFHAGITGIALYVEDDPIWSKLEKGDDFQEYFDRHGWHGIPLAIHFDTTDPDEVAKQYLRWLERDKTPETRKHNGQTYVKLAATPTKYGDYTCYYAKTPRGVVFACNEDVIRRALDRHHQRAETAKEKKPRPSDAKLRPWLGDHTGLQLNRGALKLLSAVLSFNYQQMMQTRSWNNLPILTELKRRYPDRDPVALYEKAWGIRLYCPGGGQYAWNGEWHTMESTVFGHPGQPKRGPLLPQGLSQIEHLDFGLTFENDGLRARTVLQRAK